MKGTVWRTIDAVNAGVLQAALGVVVEQAWVVVARRTVIEREVAITDDVAVLEAKGKEIHKALQ